MAKHAISQRNVTPLPAIPLQPTADQSPLRVGFRLVPASIGRPGNVQTVYIQCPTWCHVDHVEVREIAVEDITHYGPGGGLQIADMSDDLTSLIDLYVNIISDPAAAEPGMRAAHLVVANAGPHDAHLSDAQASELVANLRRLADDVEQAQQVVRAANRGEGV